MFIDNNRYLLESLHMVRQCECYWYCSSRACNYRAFGNRIDWSSSSLVIVDEERWDNPDAYWDYPDDDNLFLKGY